MFQKRVAVDKKKLLSKVLDLKKDPLTRLKYLKQLSDYTDRNELCSIIRQHYSFIYYTFIDTFSSFDCGNAKQRQTKTAKEDLDVLLFVLEKMLIFNTELIKKRWQFYSITFVMQKLLHNHNSIPVRQEGLRLFLIWYQIIADPSDTALERIFASLVPNLVPISESPCNNYADQNMLEQQQSNIDRDTLSYRYNQSAINPSQHQPLPVEQQQSRTTATNSSSGNTNNNYVQRPNNINFQGTNQAGVSRQLSTAPSTPSTPTLCKQLSYPSTPIRSCSIDPVMPIHPGDLQPNDSISFYLECLLNFMVTQTTKIIWEVPNVRQQQEQCFAFLFDMFKTVYLTHLFPDFNHKFSFDEPKFLPQSSDNVLLFNELKENQDLSGGNVRLHRNISTPTSPTVLRELGAINIHQNEVPNTMSHNISGQSADPYRLSLYQSIMIRWLSRFMRQDPLPGQDDLLAGGQQRGERSLNDYYYYTTNKNNENSVSGVQFQNDDPTSTSVASVAPSNVDFLDVTSKEFDIARTVAGTWPKNIDVVHELFRQAFCNYYQPQSMKRVVNVYKEWICNASPDPISSTGEAAIQDMQNKRIGYTSFPNLLQVFVINSSNAFVTPISSVVTLEEQVEMCKRIMNIYRFMVMKIYMNQSTWEQLLNVMMYVTKKLFSIEPPIKKEASIGGRIAPAFFQTFIVSWIRANLYVHIPDTFWERFQQIMASLIKWRELLEEWSTTMDSLTRVLVKHVYDLSLSDLPLERPLDRRRRPKNMKSFSTVETLKNGSVPIDHSAKLHNLSKQISPQKHNYRNNNHEQSISGANINSSKQFQLGSIRSGGDRNNFLLARFDSTGVKHEAFMSRITRSCSDGFLNVNKFSARFANLYSTTESSLFLNNNETTTLRKFRSEYLRQQCEAELFDCSPHHSRSPSPSNAIIDATSLKDSNLIIPSPNQSLDNDNKQMNSLNAADNNTNNRQQQSSDVAIERKCVLAGGIVRGWTQENSVIMWRRMLGLFGNVNQISDPGIHFVAMRCLAKILSDFIKTRENLGVSVDNQTTPSPPSMVPPYTYFSAWLFQATYLSDAFKTSKLLAYKMICVSSVRRHDIEISPQYFSTLYQTLHRGLNCGDTEIRNVIIRYIGATLFSINLPGCTILTGDLVEACHKVILADKLEGPREEAVQLLSSALSLHKQVRKLMVLECSQDEITLVACGDLRDKILSLLGSCDKLTNMEAVPKALSLCAVAVQIYQELCEKQLNADMEKYVDVILSYTSQRNKFLCRTGCDMLRLLSDHANFLTTNCPNLVRKSINTLCSAIQDCYYNQNDNKESISSLLLCLYDWCFNAGLKFMLKACDSNNEADATGESPALLHTVMDTLQSIVDDELFRIQQINNTDNKSTLVAESSNSLAEHEEVDEKRDRTLTNETISSGAKSARLTNKDGGSSATTSHGLNDNLLPDRNDLRYARLACRFLYVRLLNYLGHFPLKYLGATSLSCCIEETEYLPSEQETDFQNAENLCIFVVNDSTIISFIGVTPAQLPTNTNTSTYTTTPGSPVTLVHGGNIKSSKDLSTSQTSSTSLQSSEFNSQSFQVHIILRDLCGKYAWECKNFSYDDNHQLQSMIQDTQSLDCKSKKSDVLSNTNTFRNEIHDHHHMDGDDLDDEYHDETLTDDLSASSNSSSSRNRDYLESLINQLNHCLPSELDQHLNGSTGAMMKKRNSAQSVSNPKCKIGQAEEIMIALLTNQRFQELNHCDHSAETYDSQQIRSSPLSVDINSNGGSNGYRSHSSIDDETLIIQQNALPFEKCRQLIEQLGYMTWEKRTKIDMLTKNGRLLRELRNLDKQPGRETHKIAVIYVASGQEDKNSILTNSTGSRAFEDFVSGLGWEVNLANHLGFKGGLQTNKSTGETSPYYCDNSTEIMFHVSTRIPVVSATDEESLNRKLRHLGNDEIHIIWSEHSRDYRRGIIPTEFGDVIIVVYPLQTFIGFFRIQILCKPEVPFFGPLFNNSIVHQSSLSSLVRATAINASRAKRFKIPFFQSHFEERNKSIETIVQNQKERLPFEDFASKLYTTNSIYMKKLYPDKTNNQSGCSSPASERSRPYMFSQQVELTTTNTHRDLD